jgi:serine/threonine-protein kinase RsbW
MSAPVTITFEADTRNVSLARTMAAAMAARADLPIDQLEDVRLAVDEAVSQVVLAAPAGGIVELTFAETGQGLDITVTAPSTSTAPPPKDTFSWMVLTALVDGVTADVADGRLRLALVVIRGLTVDA